MDNFSNSNHKEQELINAMALNVPKVSKKLKNSVFDLRRNKTIDVKWEELFRENNDNDNDLKNRLKSLSFNAIEQLSNYFNQSFSKEELSKVLMTDIENKYWICSHIKNFVGFEQFGTVKRDFSKNYLSPIDTTKDSLIPFVCKKFDFYTNVFCLKRESNRLYAFFDKKEKPLFYNKKSKTVYSKNGNINITFDDKLTIEEFWKHLLSNDNLREIKYVIIDESFEYEWPSLNPPPKILDPRYKVILDKDFATNLKYYIEKNEQFEYSKLTDVQKNLLVNYISEENSFQDVNIIRKDINLYKQEFHRLESQKEFIEAIFQNFDAKTGTLGESKLSTIIEEEISTLFKNKELLGTYADTFETLKTRKAIIQEKIDQLVSRAKKQGFFLATKDEIKFDDKRLNIKIEVKKGEIYRVDAKTTSYAHTTRNSSSTFFDLFFPLTNSILFSKKIGTDISNKGLLGDVIGVVSGAVGSLLGLGQSSQTHTQMYNIPYDDYIKVTFDNDPVQEEVDRLKQKGKNIYFVHKRKYKFVTEDNIPLEVILKRCEEDESFRRKTVIAVPIYDTILSDYKFEIGAKFYLNPLPAVISTRFPEIALLEDLSYKMDWIGTELGELVDSINLAPGETRSITMSAKFTQASSNTSSYKNISDFSIVNTSDISTEFENEFRKESTTKNSLEADANLNFEGIGDFGASGGSETTINEFSRQINKVATKATSNISKKIQTEISTTNINSTSIEEATSKTSTISNINQGRTLNLFIYKINNIYKSGLHLNNLRVVLNTSTELIEGSGLFNKIEYNLSDNELDLFINQLNYQLSFLPYDYKNKAEIIISKKIKQEIESYTNTANDKNIEFQKRPFELIEKQYENQKDMYSKKDKSQELNDLKAYLNSIKYKDVNISPTKLLLPSGAFYIDSMVGLNPSTEKYSEKMRALEQEKVKAEIDKLDAINDDLRAKTRLLDKNETYIIKMGNHLYNSKENYTGYSIIHLSKSINKKVGFLKLKNYINDDKWSVYLSDKNMECKVKTSIDGFQIKIYWVFETPTIEDLKINLTLINKDITLRFQTFN